MNTENLSTLKIHKLTQEQYDRELDAGRIDENALYLTPDKEIDLSSYATHEYVDTALANFSSGRTLTEHFEEEIMVLTSLQYGDTLPDPNTPGRIFFKKVAE